MTHSTTPLPSWAEDASFGIFVHWGPYSVPAWAEPSGPLGEGDMSRWFVHNAYAEWYMNTIRIDDSPARQHHLTQYGDMPYHDFLDQWKAESYDPDDWASLFRKAGADYVIPVTKHHDGVTLWDAPNTNGLNTVSRGPQRDLLEPLATAVRAEGVRFGVYYSGGLDWAFTDLPPIVSVDDVNTVRPNDTDYARYAEEHVRDLIDRFAPSVIWNDINWPDSAKHDGTLVAMLDHYRTIVPDGIVNDRWGMDVWDFRTSEYSYDTANESGMGWEHNRGLGFSFSYNSVEDASVTLDARAVAALYSDIVSRGGRLLLNVGPEASGVIPPLQRQALEDLAPWMAEVKPHTLGRSMVDADTVTVTSPHSPSPWFRAWRTGTGATVVVVDDLDATAVSDDGPVVVMPLPPAAHQ